MSDPTKERLYLLAQAAGNLNVALHALREAKINLEVAEDPAAKAITKALSEAKEATEGLLGRIDLA